MSALAQLGEDVGSVAGSRITWNKTKCSSGGKKKKKKKKNTKKKMGLSVGRFASPQAQRSAAIGGRFSTRVGVNL